MLASAPVARFVLANPKQCRTIFQIVLRHDVQEIAYNGMEIKRKKKFSRYYYNNLQVRHPLSYIIDKRGGGIYELLCYLFMLH